MADEGGAFLDQKRSIPAITAKSRPKITVFQDYFARHDDSRRSPFSDSWGLALAVRSAGVVHCGSRQPIRSAAHCKAAAFELMKGTTGPGR